MTEAMLADYGLVVGAFLVCLISGFVPIVNAELFLVAATALATTNWVDVVLLVVMSTLGEMVAKVTMYWGGDGLQKLSPKKYQHKLDSWKAKFHGSPVSVMGFIALSAVVGLPPFYIIAILAGTFGVPFVPFVIIGTIGRALRFAIVCIFPALLL